MIQLMHLDLSNTLPDPWRRDAHVLMRKTVACPRSARRLKQTPVLGQQMPDSVIP